MASEIQVYKAAALGVGSETTITSPTDDRPLARKIRAAWDLQRRSAIRDGSWNFAARRKNLPALDETPDFEFDHAYQLPAGCLRLLEVRSGNVQLGIDEYQLEGGKILCNFAGPLQVRYLIDITEPADWDDAFADAFGQRIAWKIGRSVAGSSFNEGEAREKYFELLAAAKRVDAAENPGIGQAESDWIRARDHGAAGMGTWISEDGREGVVR